jgi:hypothetical protein
MKFPTRSGMSLLVVIIAEAAYFSIDELVYEA